MWEVGHHNNHTYIPNTNKLLKKPLLLQFQTIMIIIMGQENRFGIGRFFVTKATEFSKMIYFSRQKARSHDLNYKQKRIQEIEKLETYCSWLQKSFYFSRRHLYCQRIDVIYPYFVLPVIISIRFLYFLYVSLTAKQMFDKANFSPEILCRVGVPLMRPFSSKLLRKIRSRILIFGTLMPPNSNECNKSSETWNRNNQ